MKKRIFSGAQPTGELHLGNYLGALKNWVALQDEYESFFCIVNLHAVTLPQNPAILKQKTLDLARIYLASGINPEKSTIFIQSDVSAHAELAWILSCVARMGELERMTQFKDKGKGKGEKVGVGLFTYPILMASDILLYQTNLVPVGQDQKQHLELARDLAERFNRDFGETFAVPEPFIPPVGAKIQSLQDPLKKMSKSDENGNGAIFLLDDADTITKKLKKAVTDSGTEITFDDERPAIKNLLTVYRLMTGKTAEECVENFAGKGYGHFKTETAEAIIEFLRPFQERVKEFSDEDLKKILKTGAEKAESVARETLNEVYGKMGIVGAIN
ncbi:MAG: tryptophanyl-tRNA synthetase [Acidobacteria bacterium]|jgi:tryptophanyl-tRNA synthetase|nr:tryptophanyl-tRNA synthetase [Acidobacteriota bacterium]